MESELISKTKLLESKYASQLDRHVWIELCKLKSDLAILTGKKIKFQMQRLPLENFEYNNHFGIFLTNPLKANRERTTISFLKNPDGKLAHNPEDINRCLRHFYRNLYSSEKDPSEAAIDRFLNSIELPKRNKEQVALNAEKAFKRVNWTFLFATHHNISLDFVIRLYL